MLTDIECRSALANLYFIALLNCQNEKLKVELRKEFDVLVDLINEHFANPPLKFEELKKYMWVWIDGCKMYDQIQDLVIDGEIKIVVFNCGSHLFYEGSLYRKKVE